MQDPPATDRAVDSLGIPAWHFLPSDLKLTHGDGRPVTMGQTTRLSDPTPVSLSHHGLHASERILDALRLAPGPVLCRVVLRGDVQGHGDILVARERHVAWMQDVTPLLHRFALVCGRHALEVLEAPDSRLRSGLDAKDGWLRGNVNEAQMTKAWEQTFAVSPSCRDALDWAVVQTVSQASCPHDVVNTVWQACQESIQVDLLKAGQTQGRDEILERRRALLESLVDELYPEALAASADMPRSHGTCS